MKKTFFLFSTAILLSFYSCNKDDDSLQLDCTGDCIFGLSNAIGVMVHLDCFDRYAIKTSMSNVDGENPIFGIPDVVGADFQQPGKVVRFSATFRANQLTPTFPDPSIDMGSLYQIQLVQISEQH